MRNIVALLLFLAGLGFSTVLAIHGVMGIYWFWGSAFMFVVGTAAAILGISFTARFELSLLHLIKQNGDDIYHKLMTLGYIAAVVMLYLYIVDAASGVYGVFGTMFTVLWMFYIIDRFRHWDLNGLQIKR